MRLCPRCAVRPSRKAVGGTKIAYCRECYTETRAMNSAVQHRAKHARRVRARLAAGPRPCSKCGVNPPRYPPPRQGGTVPLCEACFLGRTEDRNSDKTRWPSSARSYDDLPAAEIERRFQAALKQIRSRAWTLDSAS